MQTLIISVILLAGITARGHAQGMPAELAQFLRATIAVTPDELRAVEAGTPVVRVLEPADRREVGTFGIVRIGVPRAFYVQRASDFPAALREASRPALGLFSNPATAADAAGFTLPAQDVEDLAKCRVGSCKLKLSQAAIGDLRALLAANSGAPEPVVNDWFRAHMAEYVTRYRARGNPGLIVYQDRDSSSAAARVFDSMVARSPYMYQYSPALERYLQRYPVGAPPGIREVLFWSTDALPGLRPTLTINQQVVYAPPELPGATLIALKQLYSSHYTDGRLVLTAVVEQDAPANAAPALYLVVVERLHFDNLPSGGVTNVRGRVIGRLRGSAVSQLSEARTRSETAWAARH